MSLFNLSFPEEVHWREPSTLCSPGPAIILGPPSPNRVTLRLQTTIIAAPSQAPLIQTTHQARHTWEPVTIVPSAQGTTPTQGNHQFMTPRSLNNNYHDIISINKESLMLVWRSQPSAERPFKARCAPISHGSTWTEVRDYDTRNRGRGLQVGAHCGWGLAQKQTDPPRLKWLIASNTWRSFREFPKRRGFMYMTRFLQKEKKKKRIIYIREEFQERESTLNGFYHLLDQTQTEKNMLTAAVQALCSSPPKQSCNLLTTSFELPSLLNAVCAVWSVC